jgi:hypothetical protein
VAAVRVALEASATRDLGSVGAVGCAIRGAVTAGVVLGVAGSAECAGGDLTVACGAGSGAGVLGEAECAGGDLTVACGAGSGAGVLSEAAGAFCGNRSAVARWVAGVVAAAAGGTAAVSTSSTNPNRAIAPAAEE